MDLMLTLASRRISMCLWTPARDTPRSLASSCPDRGNPSLSRAMICTLCATPSSTRLFPRAQSIHVSADDTEIGLIGTKLIPLASKLEKPALKHVNKRLHQVHTPISSSLHLHTRRRVSAILYHLRNPGGVRINTLLQKVKQLVPSSTAVWIGLGAAGLLVLLLAPLLIDASLSHNRIHSGISINGSDVGRMTQEEADALISKQAQEVAKKEMHLTGDGSFMNKTLTSLRLYWEPTDIPLEGTVDTSALDKLMEEIGEILDRPATDARLQLVDGKVTVLDSTDGSVVDREELRGRIKQRLFTLDVRDIEIPMMVTEPYLKAADTETAANQAEVMLSAPITVTSGEDEWTLTTQDIASYLDFTVKGTGADSRLVPVISAEKATVFLDRIAAAVRREPVDARWETDGEVAKVVPHAPGFQLDPDATAEAITTASLSSNPRTAEVHGTYSLPGLTTTRARTMGIQVKLASYTTHFGGSSNRRANVQRAAELINNTLLAPGEEFDFDTVVGKRTSENGFKLAPVIIRGKLEDSLGGGICQVSTTLFNAVFFAGLNVTARSNHSLYISHYPMGRDATVSWGGPAFRFKNDTDHWILIPSASTSSTLLFVIYGTSDGREVEYTTSAWYNIRPSTEKKETTNELAPGETKVDDPGQTGRSVTVQRTVARSGTLVHEDTFRSNYPMKPKVIKVGPATTSTTVPKSTTTTITGSTSSTTSTTAPSAASTTTTTR